MRNNSLSLHCIWRNKVYKYVELQNKKNPMLGTRKLQVQYICNKIFVPALNLFRQNLFHRKFVLSRLFKWKISSWNIFHRKIYSTYVKFVLVQCIYFTTNSEICSGMNMTKTIISFFVRQSLIFFSNIWLIGRQWCKIPNVIKK